MTEDLEIKYAKRNIII